MPPTGRIVVYTANVAGYDELKPPRIQFPGLKFVVFSDEPVRTKGWVGRPINYLHHDPARAARFVKLHPHVYFPEHDFSIWVDANVEVRGDIRRFVNRLSGGACVGAFPHPMRDCIYEQGDACIARKQDRPETIRQHLERFRLEGFPEKAGMWSTSVIVRRHNDPTCIDLMSAWWRELEVGSRRDELSLPVVAGRRSIGVAPLGEFGLATDKRDVIAVTDHLRERAISGLASPPVFARAAVDVDTIPVDVGVCVHNGLAETEACLGSLVAARRPNQRIIIIDDASDAPTAGLLDRFATIHENVQLVRHEQNQGYTASANDVLRNSKGRWTILLNSDTIVPSRALGKLVACGEQFGSVGIVGPLSNAATWQTVPRLSGPDGKWMVNRIPEGMSVEDIDRLCEELSGPALPFVPLINGFCFAVRRKLVEAIGLFDDVNFPIGYGEEDDYCLRAGAAGFHCAIATDTYIYHKRSASFTPERRPGLVASGQQALRRLHGSDRIAAAVDVLRRHPQLAQLRELLSERLDERPPGSVAQPAVPAVTTAGATLRESLAGG